MTDRNAKSKGDYHMKVQGAAAVHDQIRTLISWLLWLFQCILQLTFVFTHFTWFIQFGELQVVTHLPVLVKISPAPLL
jgi:hypothetical protein